MDVRPSDGASGTVSSWGIGTCTLPENSDPSTPFGQIRPPVARDDACIGEVLTKHSIARSRFGFSF